MVVCLFIYFIWLWKRLTNLDFQPEYVAFPRRNSTLHVNLNLLDDSNSIPVSKTKQVFQGNKKDQAITFNNNINKIDLILRGRGADRNPQYPKIPNYLFSSLFQNIEYPQPSLGENNRKMGGKVEAEQSYSFALPPAITLSSAEDREGV